MEPPRTKKKVLYLVTKGNWGGAQRYVYDLAASLPRNEFEVIVALGGNGLLTERLTAHNIKTLPVSGLQRDVSLAKEISAFFSLWRTFRKLRLDIVHLNSPKAGGLGALAARIAGIPRIIFTVHGWPFNEVRNRFWKGLAWLGSYATAFLSTDIVVISSRDFEQARAMPGVTAKTHLIPNGIQTAAFFSREEARGKLGLPQDVLVVGSIGELTRNKEYPDLVSVAAKLMGERYNFKLVVIGEGEGRAEITQRIKENRVLDGQEVLLGFKEDAYKYLKAFDIFVLNSRKEGLPYVLLEAGAAGLPVAATFVGGIPDIIKNDKTGLLATPDFKMIDALRKLLTEKGLRERLGTALEERVETVFQFERMRAETVRLYNQ